MTRPSERKTYRWDFALLKGADDAINLQLPVHVGLLLLEVNRSIYGSHGYCSSSNWFVSVDRREWAKSTDQDRTEVACLGCELEGEGAGS